MNTVEHYFGGCPECGQTNGYLNVRSNHIFFCDAHKTAWSIGANLFSSWKDEDEGVWRRNAEKLDGYREVKPLPEGAPLPRPGPSLQLIQGGRKA